MDNNTIYIYQSNNIYKIFICKYILFIFCMVLFVSCKNKISDSKSNRKVFNFYEWGQNANCTYATKEVLSSANTKTIYIHYFDIVNQLKNEDESEPYPTYVINEIDSCFSDYEIVPVVFIANSVSNKIDLHKKISNLVNQISMSHFKKKFSKLQLDCDWDEHSRSSYFTLIDSLSKTFEVSATIRLHQIKYKYDTGIPPVKKGVLMLYNVGEFGRFDENSILDSRIVNDYISSDSDYPIKLDIALPLFSQIVLKNNDGVLRLMSGQYRHELEENKNIFSKTNDNVYLVKKDTLFKGFYLSKGFNLKIEDLNFEEIENSYSIVKSSKLNLCDIILYRLDDQLINSLEYNKLIQKL